MKTLFFRGEVGLEFIRKKRVKNRGAGVAFGFYSGVKTSRFRWNRV